MGPRVEDLGAAQSDIEGDAQAHVPLTEGAKEAFDALQAQRDQHSAQHAQHDGDNDEEGHGTDSSSDFSYRYFPGSNTCMHGCHACAACMLYFYVT